jgi:hypothetical protein
MSHRILPAVLLAALMGMIVQTARADDAKAVRIAGQLTKVDGPRLTIASETDGKETTITCNDATQYRQDGNKVPLTLAAFKAGQKVRAYYRSADNVALTVILAQAGAGAGGDGKQVRLVGTLTKIAGNTITIKGDTDGQEIVLTCTDATRYGQDGSQTKITLGDFKVGQHVRTYYVAKDKTVGLLMMTNAA